MKKHPALRVMPAGSQAVWSKKGSRAAAKRRSARQSRAVEGPPGKRALPSQAIQWGRQADQRQADQRKGKEVSHMGNRVSFFVNF